MSRAFAWRFRFALGLLALSIGKLWLIHDQPIYGSATWFDALWYLRSAQHWYWGEPYSWTAFIRPPAYPLWLALVHLAGMPLRIAAELWELAGFAILVIALRRVGLAIGVCLTIYALTIFHPANFEMTGYSMADTFYAAMLPMALGGCIFVWQTRSKLHALWTGFALAVLWNTREESVLVLLIFATLVALLLVRRKFRESWPALAITGATAGVVVLAVYTANDCAFGSFARSAMSARDFVSAYEALLSVKPPETQRFVPVTRAARMMAYQVSPTWAKLKPELEGPIGERWETNTRQSYGISGEISAGLMVWALRDAANAIGEHATPTKAAHFYRKIAQEIRRAEKAGELPARAVWAGPMDPAAVQSLPFFPRSLGRMAKSFFLKHEPLPTAEDALLTPDERALYAEMTGRRLPNEAKSANARLAESVRRGIGSIQRYLIGALSFAAGIGLLIAPFHRRRIEIFDSLGAVIILLAITIASRVLLFAVLDATSWTSNQLRYLYPVLPLYSAWLLLVLAQAWRARKANGAVSVAAAAPRNSASSR